MNAIRIALVALLLMVPAAPASAQLRELDPQQLDQRTLDRVPIVLLVDLSSGQVLYEKNAQRRFVPASITKAMTALLAFEFIDQGRLRLDQRFTFSPAAFAKWGGQGSTMFLNAGDEIAVSDLLTGISTVSANDASVALAQGAVGSDQEWLRQMNALARETGMTQSHFGTPNGWPDEGRTFTTAQDLVRLGTRLTLQHPELYARFFGRRAFSYGGITQRNHDPITGRVRGADGIKTGFTNEAGYGFLGSARRGNRRLVLVVAGAGFGRDRDRAAREILEWGFSAFKPRWLFAAGETVGEAKVQGGGRRHVGLISLHPVSASLPAHNDATVDLRIVYDGPVRAPIAKGQRIAELEIAVSGMPVSRVPLFAAQEVEQAGPIARLANGLMSWFV